MQKRIGEAEEEFWYGTGLSECYDLTPMNVYGYWLGIGIYHSGLEGKSFFFLLDSGFDCCSKIAEKDETIVGQFCWIVILIVEKIHCLYCCLALFDSKVCFDR